MSIRSSLGLIFLFVAACSEPVATSQPDPIAESVPVTEPAATAEEPIKHGEPKKPVKLGGDPSDPVFAGKRLSEWRAELRNPQTKSGGEFDSRALVAVKALEAYGPAAVSAIPDLLAFQHLGDQREIVRASLEAIGREAVRKQVVALWKSRPAGQQIAAGDWGFYFAPPADLAVPVLTDSA